MSCNGTRISPRTGCGFIGPRSQTFPARPGVRVLLQAGEGAVQSDGCGPQPGGGGGVPQAPGGGKRTTLLLVYHTAATECWSCCYRYCKFALALFVATRAIFALQGWRLIIFEAPDLIIV